MIDNATVANDAGITGGNHLPATTVLTLINHGVYAIYGNNNGTTQTLADWPAMTQVSSEPKTIPATTFTSTQPPTPATPTTA